MANKDLFKQAIAEAKSVREAAIANAKEALEESLTPHLKDMLAAKLQEMDDSKNEEAENVNEEEVEEGMHDKKKDEAHDKKDEAKHGKKDESIEESEEISEDETIEEAPKDEEHNEAYNDKDEALDAEANEAEDDSEESEDEAEDHDAPEGDEDVSNLTVDQFKDLIRDIIAQEVGDGAEAPADMDAGDIEGMGDEPAIDEPVDGMEVEDEEEIDLDELLAELEATAEVNEAPKDHEKNEKAHDKKEKNEAPKEKKEEATIKEKVNEEVEETNDELSQALETIETLKKELNEVNILNSKLLYVNKIFKSNDLSESQKVNIIAAFDKAETVKEVKLVYETVSDSVVSKKESNNTIKESKTKLGMASKATGTTASKPEVINEVSDTVRRMQKLAGIIK